MKIRSLWPGASAWIFAIFLLASALVLESCSSSYQGSRKGRHGMVPCPCEKQSKRR